MMGGALNDQRDTSFVVCLSHKLRSAQKKKKKYIYIYIHIYLENSSRKILALIG